LNLRIQGSRQTELDLERGRRGPRKGHAHSAFRRHSAHCPPPSGQARRPGCQRIAQVGLVRQQPMPSRPMRPSLPRKHYGALNTGCTFAIPPTYIDQIAHKVHLGNQSVERPPTGLHVNSAQGDDSIDVLTAAFANGKQISERGQPPVKTARNVGSSNRDLDLLGIWRFGQIDHVCFGSITSIPRCPRYVRSCS
jgi:hypothetical protein